MTVARPLNEEGATEVVSANPTRPPPAAKAQADVAERTRPDEPFPDDPAHDDAVDRLLDAFPGAEVIAEGCDERARAFRYQASRCEAEPEAPPPESELDLP